MSRYTAIMPDGKKYSFEADREPTEEEFLQALKPPETSAAGTFGREMAAGALPTAAAVGAGAGLMSLVGAELVAGLGTMGTSLALIPPTLAVGALAAYGQRKGLEAAAPEFAYNLQRELEAGRQQHPVAAFGGELAAALPSAKFMPQRLLNRKEFVKHFLPSAAVGGTVGAVQPLVFEQRKPTLTDVGAGALGFGLFGEPRGFVGVPAHVAGRVMRGRPYASSVQEATALYGPMLPFTGKGPGEVSAQGRGEGVQSQAQSRVERSAQILLETEQMIRDLEADPEVIGEKKVTTNELGEMVTTVEGVNPQKVKQLEALRNQRQRIIDLHQGTADEGTMAEAQRRSQQLTDLENQIAALSRDPETGQDPAKLKQLDELMNQRDLIQEDIFGAEEPSKPGEPAPAPAPAEAAKTAAEPKKEKPYYESKKKQAMEGAATTEPEVEVEPGREQTAMEMLEQAQEEDARNAEVEKAKSDLGVPEDVDLRAIVEKVVRGEPITPEEQQWLDKWKAQQDEMLPALRSSIEDEAKKLGKQAKLIEPEDIPYEPPADPNEPFAMKALRKRRWAFRRKKYEESIAWHSRGTININLKSLQWHLFGRSKAQQRAIIERIMNEEHLHSFTRRSEARRFYDAASSEHRHRAHVEYTGLTHQEFRERYGFDLTPEDLGYEMIRQEIQKMSLEGMRETIERAHRDRWSNRVLDAMDGVILRMRMGMQALAERFGIQPTNIQLKILRDVTARIKAVRQALARGEQAPGYLEGAAEVGPAVRMKPGAESDEQFSKRFVDTYAKVEKLPLPTDLLDRTWQSFRQRHLEEGAGELPLNPSPREQAFMTIDFATTPYKEWRLPEAVKDQMAAHLQKLWETQDISRLDLVDLRLDHLDRAAAKLQRILADPNIPRMRRQISEVAMRKTKESSQKLEQLRESLVKTKELPPEAREPSAWYRGKWEGDDPRYRKLEEVRQGLRRISIPDSLVRHIAANIRGSFLDPANPKDWEIGNAMENLAVKHYNDWRLPEPVKQQVAQFWKSKERSSFDRVNFIDNKADRMRISLEHAKEEAAGASYSRREVINKGIGELETEIQRLEVLRNSIMQNRGRPPEWYVPAAWNKRPEGERFEIGGKEITDPEEHRALRMIVDHGIRQARQKIADQIQFHQNEMRIYDPVRDREEHERAADDLKAWKDHAAKFSHYQNRMEGGERIYFYKDGKRVNLNYRVRKENSLHDWNTRNDNEHARLINAPIPDELADQVWHHYQNYRGGPRANRTPEGTMFMMEFLAHVPYRQWPMPEPVKDQLMGFWNQRVGQSFSRLDYLRHDLEMNRAGLERARQQLWYSGGPNWRMRLHTWRRFLRVKIAGLADMEQKIMQSEALPPEDYQPAAFKKPSGQSIKAGDRELDGNEYFAARMIFDYGPNRAFEVARRKSDEHNERLRTAPSTMPRGEFEELNRDATNWNEVLNHMINLWSDRDRNDVVWVRPSGWRSSLNHEVSVASQLSIAAWREGRVVLPAEWGIPLWDEYRKLWHYEDDRQFPLRPQEGDMGQMVSNYASLPDDQWQLPDHLRDNLLAWFMGKEGTDLDRTRFIKTRLLLLDERVLPDLREKYDAETDLNARADLKEDLDDVLEERKETLDLLKKISDERGLPPPDISEDPGLPPFARKKEFVKVKNLMSHGPDEIPLSNGPHWMDPSGKLYRVSGHERGAAIILGKITREKQQAYEMNIDEEDANVSELWKRGWLRMSMFNREGIYVEGPGLTNAQKRELKNIGIETDKVVSWEYKGRKESTLYDPADYRGPGEGQMDLPFARKKEGDFRKVRNLTPHGPEFMEFSTGSHWLSPGGEMIKVWGHEPGAAVILGVVDRKNQFKLPGSSVEGAHINQLYDKGWTRVFVDDSRGIIHAESEDMTNSQKRELINRGIEKEMRVLWDKVGTGRQILLYDPQEFGPAVRKKAYETPEERRKREAEAAKATAKLPGFEAPEVGAKQPPGTPKVAPEPHAPLKLPEAEPGPPPSQAYFRGKYTKESLQDEINKEVEAHKPNLRKLIINWENNYRLPAETARMMFQEALGQHLLKAPGERLVELAKSTGAVSKVVSRMARKMGVTVHDVPDPEQVESDRMLENLISATGLTGPELLRLHQLQEKAAKITGKYGVSPMEKVELKTLQKRVKSSGTTKVDLEDLRKTRVKRQKFRTRVMGAIWDQLTQAVRDPAPVTRTNLTASDLAYTTDLPQGAFYQFTPEEGRNARSVANIAASGARDESGVAENNTRRVLALLGQKTGSVVLIDAYVKGKRYLPSLINPKEKVAVPDLRVNLSGKSGVGGRHRSIFDISLEDSRFLYSFLLEDPVKNYYEYFKSLKDFQNHFRVGEAAGLTTPTEGPAKEKPTELLREGESTEIVEYEGGEKAKETTYRPRTKGRAGRPLGEAVTPGQLLKPGANLDPLTFRELNALWRVLDETEVTESYDLQAMIDYMEETARYRRGLQGRYASALSALSKMVTRVHKDRLNAWEEMRRDWEELRAQSIEQQKKYPPWDLPYPNEGKSHEIALGKLYEIIKEAEGHGDFILSSVVEFGQTSEPIIPPPQYKAPGYKDVTVPDRPAQEPENLGPFGFTMRGGTVKGPRAGPLRGIPWHGPEVPPQPVEFPPGNLPMEGRVGVEQRALQAEPPPERYEFPKPVMEHKPTGKVTEPYLRPGQAEWERLQGKAAKGKGAPLPEDTSPLAFYKKPKDEIELVLNRVARSTNAIVTRKNTTRMLAATIDYAHNDAANAGRQEDFGVREITARPYKGLKEWWSQVHKGNPKVLAAAIPMIQAGFDIKMLDHFDYLIGLGDQLARRFMASRNWQDRIRGKRMLDYGKTLKDEVAYARSHWNDPELMWTALVAKNALDRQYNRELGAGMKLRYDENYVPGRLESEFFNDDRIMFGDHHAILGRNWRAPKTHKSYYDAYAHGYIAVSRDIASIVGHRVRQGVNRINYNAWAQNLKIFTDDVSGKPIAADAVKRPDKTFAAVDAESELFYPRKGADPISVRRGWLGLVENLTTFSNLHHHNMARSALEFAQRLKHMMLIGDFFHLMRVGYYSWALLGRKFTPAGFKHGLAAIDYTPQTLRTAVAMGMVSPEAAAWVEKPETIHLSRGQTTQMTNREIGETLGSFGLNNGRIQDALYKELVDSPILGSIPVIGHFLRGVSRYNRWLFDNVTRGFITQAGIENFKRLNKANPNMSITDLAKDVARDMNLFYGNIGKQGWIKSATWQDIARLGFLAPQWVEGLVMKDVEFASRLATAPLAGRVPYRQKLPHMGALGQGMAMGLLAMIGMTQALNVITRRKPTWENDEEGHKFDAWIPIGDGKSVWLSPLAVFNELTHDVVRLFETKPKAWDALRQIGQNKLSPYGRAVMVMTTSTTPTGQYITDTPGVLQTAAEQLAPLPISGARAAQQLGSYVAPGLIHPVPREQIGRQAFALAGLKVEPVLSDISRVQQAAEDFIRKNDLKKSTGWMEVQTDEPSYTKLRAAIRAGDKSGAREIFMGLRRTHTTEQILKSMKLQAVRPFTGSHDNEARFLNSLNDQQLEAYSRAMEGKQKLYQDFVDWYLSQEGLE